MSDSSQKLPVTEKLGYSLGDAAANFVFMTMVLFQANFYTDVMGITAGIAGWLLLVPRMWDAFFDPIMGIMADRTRTRWGRFRPWILFTALPWGIVMYLAYRTPHGWSETSLIAYAFITNLLLMTLYSANNMPYAALGGVMTGDSYERTSLNAYRFVAVNLAQLIVTGFTLPLVAKFAASHGEGETARATGWEITMGIWAVVCVICFLITFATTRERLAPTSAKESGLGRDFADLFANGPWKVMAAMTLIHFAIISLRGGAFYNYYHYFADKTAMFDWLSSLGLTESLTQDGASHGGLLQFLGWIAYGDRAHLEGSNVADVGYSVIGVIEKMVFIVMILLSPTLTAKFGKKAIAVTGFALMTVVSGLWYLPQPTQIGWMVALTALGAVAYGPTIPVLWAMFADVADYSEWKNGHTVTGIVFATICFALKLGLSLGSFLMLQLLGSYGYIANQAQSAGALEGIRLIASFYPTVLFMVCTVLLVAYRINKQMTLEIAADLAARRQQAPPAQH